MAVRMGLVGALVGVTVLVGCDSDAPRTAGALDASTDRGGPGPSGPDARPRESGVHDGAPGPTGHPDVGPPPPDAHDVPDVHGVPDAEPPDTIPDAGPDAPPPAAHLLGSTPLDGAVDVPKTAWIRLDFAPGLPAGTASAVALGCGTGTPDIDVDAVGNTLVVNPRSPLPAGGACTVSFPGATGTEHVAFTVATEGNPAVVAYDRNDPTLFDPFPDDYYLVKDASTLTQFRVDIRVPTVEENLGKLFTSAIAPTKAMDGMSPLAPIVVSLPDALDPASIPGSAKDSLDPFASLGLFDIDPSSNTRGERVPFDALLRDETNHDATLSHVLIVFPSVPLRPRGHYAFAVTGRALVSPSRPLEASTFFQRVATGGASSADEKRLEPFLTTVLTELRATTPPLRADDLALALGITVRSVDDIPSDLLSVREQLQAAAPPAFTVTDAVADSTANSDVAAIVTGTWSPPRWTTDGKFIDRDTGGKPKPGAPQPIPFVMALPKSAGPAPLIVYQHGQPGSAEVEVPYEARKGLAKAGFAVIGFTDFANREIIPDGQVATLNADALLALFVDQQLPDYLSLLTHADQLALLRMIPTLDVDVLPLGAPDGKNDVDPTRPLGYLGISQGSIHGTGLLPFAPEIDFAALTVGAGRFAATLVHQRSEDLYAGISQGFTTFQHREFYAGLALIQMDYDHQDPQNLAPYLYRTPLSLGTAKRANVLQTEGLGDTEVPYYSVRSGASALGIPQLEPHAADVLFLPSIQGPVQGNMANGRTAAFFQYVPKGYTGGATPTPGCVSLNETEGHFCAQIAAEAVAQRVAFFTSALAGAAKISTP